ncbi:MAG: 16S rRNA (uracil(1498)-N(3))-methyltransferase [Bacteroidetes bacterium]|nr:16S rRNA (uracil(1498)-N(3))-methyltransferase [Bacteroidota bacterium]
MHIFYTPDIHGKHYKLNKEESQHCINVLRLKEGGKIILVDGKGGYHKANIKVADRKNCIIETTEIRYDWGKRSFRLHIAIAPTKNISRFEWFLEKATEIGIDEITPLLCERSERKTIRKERLNKVIISAMKQSVKAYKPELNEVTGFMEFISKNHPTYRFIAHRDKDTRTSLKVLVKREQDILILIGPEGDFSSEEVHLACKNGFSAVLLGPGRLRTETAGIIACHTVNLLNQ